MHYNFIYFDEKKDISEYENENENENEKIDLIHINSFFTLNLLNNYVDFFKNNFKNVKKIITIHDYQWIYPTNPNILSYNFNKHEYNSLHIHNFMELIKLCKYIIFPSFNILKNYNLILDLENNDEIKNKLVMSHHCDNFINHNNLKIKNIKREINVAFIGNFIEYKGSKLFKFLFNHVKYFKNKNINYHVFGYMSDEEKKEKINHQSFIYHDYYDENKLLELLDKHNIHIITHLSLFEESYCYALTNTINSGIPILYLNHGALTERLDINIEKYFPSSYNDLLYNFNKILNYVLNNQGKIDIKNNNVELQNAKWYINNY